LGERYRSEGKRIVFTNGCFDLLHAGHVSYLQESSTAGDILVVGLNSDASVSRLKGRGRPVIRHSDRAMILAALSCVDHVVVFDEDTPHEVLHRLRPDVLIKGGTYRTDEVIGREVVLSYGGKVLVTSAVEGVSTSQIIGLLQSDADEHPAQHASIAAQGAS
jgi:D-beta-D-heptose 7-phosphate kinase/D-beta-D-heptose 1-phosphate adenosyltransferase